MKEYSSFSRLFHPAILRCASVVLFALVWGSPAFCGEIHDVVRKGDLEKIKVLLKGNPDLILSKDNNGMTPLHWAAIMGHRDVAELLLANKADVDARDDNGNTPLFKAALYGHKDVAELLLANKADVDGKNRIGSTPLFGAAMGGHKDIAELLLANKADVNARDNLGATPLLRAAYYGYKDVLELLLANKADANAKDNSGGTLKIHEEAGEFGRQHGNAYAFPPDQPGPSTESDVAPRNATASAQYICQPKKSWGLVGPLCRAYPGAALPRDQVAVLERKLWSRGPVVVITAVDGQSASVCDHDPNKYRRRQFCYSPGIVELLPGHHSITFAPEFNENNGPLTVEFNAVAGKKYKARSSGGAVSGGWGRWTVEIE